jgi:hypothetical protein
VIPTGMLMIAGIIGFVKMLKIKYLYHLFKQDQQSIKIIIKLMMGLKAIHPAKATFYGI